MLNAPDGQKPFATRQTLSHGTQRRKDELRYILEVANKCKIFPNQRVAVHKSSPHAYHVCIREESSMPKHIVPDKIETPVEFSIHQLHELVRQGMQRKRQMQQPLNQLTLKQNRWQRFVRYTWDKRQG